ncbi:hypothetical protein BsWGS_05675 [Bradybaena similaris]
MASYGQQCLYAVFVAVCLGVQAARGNICCSFQQFEADSFADNAYVFIDAGRLGLGTTYSYSNTTSHLVYDFVNNRTYYNITSVELSPLLPQPVKTHYEIISDFTKGIQYMFHDNVCLKYRTDVFEPYCVPDEAVLLSRGYIGNNQTYLDTYLVVHLPDPTSYRISVDPTNCLPMFMTYTLDSNVPDSGTMNSVMLANVKPGISNPAVFNPPSSCSTNPKNKPYQMPRSIRQKLGRLPSFMKL